MIDWDELVIAPLHEAFSEPATYSIITPVTVRTFDITVIFDDAAMNVEAGGMIVTTSNPTVGVRLSEFPADYDPELAQGDSIKILRTGDIYDVKRGKKDSKGNARLDLNLIQRWSE